MLERYIPAWSWLRTYRGSDLNSDALAGIIVAFMLVPQAMAYAMLAGLPPVFGLYASTLPVLAYALFGTSRQLAVGPVAMLSLLVAKACSPLAEAGSAEYIKMVALLALMVGLLQVALSLLRAGVLVNFVSNAVIAGFTSAGAILIGISQLGNLLGMSSGSGHSPFHAIFELAGNMAAFHWPTFALGLASVLTLVLARLRRPRVSAYLWILAGAMILVWALGLDENGIQTVGAVPAGIPVFKTPSVSLEGAAGLFPHALAIVFVGFMESIAVAQWISAREKYRVVPSRELAGLGAANLAAAFFSGYPVSGGFSRTAVNYNSGARSPIASVVSAALVLLALLFLAPLFRYLPKTVLASFILVAVADLIDFREFRRLFKIKRADGLTFLATFAVTLGIGVNQGLLSGILLSLVLFVARSSRPRTVVLGRVAGRGEYHDILRYPDLTIYPDVIMIRVDASLYFANARFVEDRIREQLSLQPGARWVLMDMSGVNDMDAVAASTLGDLMAACAGRGVGFAFAGMKAQVRDVAVKAGWKDKLGERLKYNDLNSALDALKDIPAGSAETGEGGKPRSKLV